MVKHNTAIEATTITIDSTVALTITNVYQLKTMPYMHVIQSAQLHIVVEIMLKGPTS